MKPDMSWHSKTTFLSRSVVFDRMFGQNMKEAQTGEVDMVDVEPDTLKRMLEFIYTGKVGIHMFLKFSKRFIHNRWEMRTTLQSSSTPETSMGLIAW